MAKVIRKLIINLESEVDSSSLDRTSVIYIVASADDENLKSSKEMIVELTGQDLTNAEALLDLVMGQVEDAEGI